MRSFARLITTLVLALFVLGTLPDVADATKPKPGARKSRGFSLFAAVRGLMAINRVQCGVNSAKGEVCVDITGNTVLGGGFWPRGTVDQYVFNSGLQVGGIIDPAAGFAWAGDTTGAFFFDPKGTTENGEGVQPVYNTADATDFAFISNPAATDPAALAARVPSGDASENLFNPLLRGRTAASQGDFWFVAWEGNPGLNAGRSHPLGVLVETRGMGWNFPSGNEDIIYLIYTFYNVTSLDPAAYAAVRPGMRDILLQQAQEFHQRNEASFGVDIPDAGYTITDLFAAFATDPDVAEAGANFATVNVPFAMGFVYEHTFSGAAGWTFDPAIFGPPFFPGAGFFGVKYLKSPEISPGVQAGLSLYGNTSNGGDFNDAQNAIQLYRYLSNNITPAAGDAPCNTGDPAVTHICFVNVTAPFDMRFFQSSGPLTLAPGQFGSIVVAYVFAAPVAAAGCTGPGTCSLNPGDPTRLSNFATAGTPNPIDEVAGYEDFVDDGDGVVEQTDFIVVPRSLYGKALVAQAVFDKGFLLPFAPESPNFFLIPGSGQVTVVWQLSATETTGDPFFAIASAPTNPDGTPNVLFDPNYRQLDVEGYRVYRGRVDSPNELTLLAQFDYSGTFISDFRGQVKPVESCAPEIGIDPGPDPVTGVDPCDFDPITPGVAPTKKVDVPLVTDLATGPVTQVKIGDRVALATGEALILTADTASVGAESGCLEAGDVQQCALLDTGVPFIFVDNTAQNNLRYFYSVTAFDVNSFQSGPSNLESARNTKSTTPAAAASNLLASATFTQVIEGRGVNVSQDTSQPTIDASGRFSKPAPAATAIELGFVGQFAQTIFSGQASFGAKLIGLGLGDSRNAIPVRYTYETTSSSGVLDTVDLLITQGAPTAASGDTLSVAPSAPFPAATADAAQSARYDIPPGFVQNGQITQQLAVYQRTNAFGRGCHIELGGTMLGGNCTYNGPRWFSGPNETKAHPNAGNVAGTGDATDNNNAGELPGVLTIQAAQAYNQLGAGYRIIEAALGGAVRAADFNVHWGAGGLIDSVVDITHNVPVPFLPDSIAGGWGILNQANTSAAASGDGSTGVLSLADFGCVHPFNDPAFPAGAALACPAGVAYQLSNTAVPGPVAIYGGGPVVASPPARPNPGFAMYLPGYIFLFELAPAAGVPTPGTVWTMRSYIGHVNGGVGAAGDEGPYSFSPEPRTFSAVGATARFQFTASTALAPSSEEDLSRVHTVPDPYYVTNAFEQSTDVKIIKFVNLPNDCIIRIYSSSGVLVSLLEHHSTQFGGSEDWNVRNRNNQVVASGVYFYHIEAGDARRVGRFTVVNFAQ
jgi:hypothetical protein